MLELPLVMADIQRAGPSTGMPTKTEQTDLLALMFGRNGESPIPIVAPATPGECFDYAIEAYRIALKYMTPVVFLSDAFLANGAEPWRIPDVADLPHIGRENHTDPTTFRAYERDPDTLARPWAVPGTPGLEHRIGGLEKADVSGNVSYDPDNHDRMVRLRAAKVAGIADDIPDLQVDGPPEGDLLDTRLGVDLRFHPVRRRTAQDGRQVGRPRPASAPQSAAPQHRRHPAVLPPRAPARAQPRPARDAAAGSLPHRHPELQHRPRQALQDQRDRARGRAAARRPTVTP